jgi:transcriptional regulator with XRE-family HTH domain
MKNLQEKLNRALAKTGLSTAEAASRAGIGAPYLRLILRGRRLPRSPLLLAGLARAFKIPESVLRAALLADIKEASELRLVRARAADFEDRETDSLSKDAIFEGPLEIVRVPKPRRRKV